MGSAGTASNAAGTTQELVRNQLGTGFVPIRTLSEGECGREPLSGTVQPSTITLPWEVLIADNQRHGLMRGRIRLTAKYREALTAAAQLAAFQWRAPLLKDAVRLTITLHEPDKRRRDIGNYVKLCADALTRVCYVDDSQIDRLELTRGTLDRVNPRAVIQVEAL